MKIAQTLTSIANESAGPSYSVPHLCEALTGLGQEVSLHVLNPVPERSRAYLVHGYPQHNFPLHSLKRSPEMLRGLKKTCLTADIIQINNLWEMPDVYPSWAREGTCCKLVTAPRGTLAAWSLKRSWWKKKLFGWYAQYKVLHDTDMFYATCRKEFEEIRACRLNQPVAIIPIGMDIPAVKHQTSNGLRKLLFFGRIHEVKAVDHLVLAWGQIEKRFLDWELVIAGPDCGAKSKLEAIIAEKKINRIKFAGEVNGSEKYELLASADLYVLPSKTENFAVTVAEALASGTPVIASQGTPWHGLDSNGCGWWTPVGIAPLVQQLQEALALPHDALMAMGKKGRNWIEHEFSWRCAGEKTIAAYEWLCHGGEKPECVCCER